MFQGKLKHLREIKKMVLFNPRGKVMAESPAKSRRWKHSEERKEVATITTQMVLKDQNQLVPDEEKSY